MRLLTAFLPPWTTGAKMGELMITFILGSVALIWFIGIVPSWMVAEPLVRPERPKIGEWLVIIFWPVAWAVSPVLLWVEERRCHQPTDEDEGDA